MLSLVGVGGAGCKIVEAFYRKDLVSTIISKIGGEYVRGVAIDTSDSLTSLNSIPAENRVLIGSSIAKGHGTGGNVELGKKIMKEESELAMSAVRRANIQKPELFIVISGMGGGTGTGGLPILVDRIKVTYNVPIIGILVLPSKSEGTLYIKNASDNFNEITNSLDGAILIDNNVLTSRGEDILTSHRIIGESVFNFLSAVEANYILDITRNKISTAGFMRTKAAHVSIKEVVDKMLRDFVYFQLEGKEFEGLHLIVYGNMGELYGQNFAKKWVKERFGVDLDCVFIDEPSKYLNAGLIVAGLKDIFKGLRIKEKGKPISELDELLEEIKPVF